MESQPQNPELRDNPKKLSCGFRHEVGFFSRFPYRSLCKTFDSEAVTFLA